MKLVFIFAAALSFTVNLGLWASPATRVAFNKKYPILAKEIVLLQAKDDLSKPMPVFPVLHFSLRDAKTQKQTDKTCRFEFILGRGDPICTNNCGLRPVLCRKRGYDGLELAFFAKDKNTFYLAPGGRLGTLTKDNVERRFLPWKKLLGDSMVTSVSGLKVPVALHKGPSHQSSLIQKCTSSYYSPPGGQDLACGYVELGLKRIGPITPKGWFRATCVDKDCFQASGKKCKEGWASALNKKGVLELQALPFGGC